jgi:hypothetical protein
MSSQLISPDVVIYLSHQDVAIYLSHQDVCVNASLTKCLLLITPDCAYLRISPSTDPPQDVRIRASPRLRIPQDVQIRISSSTYPHRMCVSAHLLSYLSSRMCIPTHLLSTYPSREISRFVLCVLQTLQVPLKQA